MADIRADLNLPVGGGQPWPPPFLNPVAASMRLWDAWYTGDPDRLERAYYAPGGNSNVGRSYFSTTGEPGLPTPRPGQSSGGLRGALRRFFVGNSTPAGEKRTNYHVPLAGDLASMSSSLLYAKPPALSYPDGAKASTSMQTYIEDLIDDGLHATLLEHAELGAAHGGGYLRVVWDEEVADHTWIDAVPADNAVPQFRYGKLMAVTFWQVIQDTGSKVVRHLEKHVPGQNTILHGVYEGDQKTLGRPMPLTDFEETAHLADLLTDGNAIVFDQPKDAPSVVYIPNMRPNRIWRDLGAAARPLGRSDYSGVEGLMDGLDEVYSSWMRDVRVGKARLIVPPSYLDNLGRGKGSAWEPEREVFTPLNMLAGGTDSGMITQVQFNIRYQEHSATALGLIEQIISQSGYSAQTFGMQGEVAPTATEVDARERKSDITRGKKINYERPGLMDIIYGQMSIERDVFGRTDLEPLRPAVEFQDVSMPNTAQVAQTIAALRGVEAMSVQIAVQTAHPDWGKDEVKEEVARIQKETADGAAARAQVTLTPPAAGEPGQDDPADLPADDTPPPAQPTRPGNPQGDS